MEHTQKRGQPRWKPLVGWAIGAVIAVYMIRWGGIPDIGASFYLGVLIYSLMTTGLGLAIWRLYRRPNGVAAGQRSRLSPEMQQLLALLLCVSGFVLVISLFWDELWHRRYGGFGDDFYWAPHLMLYGCILTFTGIAGFGMYRAWSRGGSIRERFRSEPALGLVGLLSLFFLISIPSDEFWHQIYGEDITAWSLPHMTLIFGAAAILLGGVAIQRGIMANTPFSRLRWLTYQEWIITILLASAFTLVVQITVGEWDTQRQPFTEASPTFWARPEWLYPVLVLWIGTLVGSLSLFALRKAGSATVVIGLALVVRMGLIAIIGNASGSAQMSVRTHAFCLIPALVFDAWSWWRAKHDPDSLHPILPLVAVGAFFPVVLPIIANTMFYPRINLQIIPWMVGFGIPAAYLGAFIGSQLGNWVHRFSHAEAHAPMLKRGVVVGSISALLIAIGIVFVVVIVAPPPQPTIPQSSGVTGAGIEVQSFTSQRSTYP